MPEMLQELCKQLNTDFNLTGDDQLNHCLVICNEQSGTGPDAHCAPKHADKIQKGFFVDISLGYARVMNLLDAESKKVVASQALASGSLAFITAHDNGVLVQGNGRGMKGTRYLHEVPVDADQPRDQPRFSLVFRPITDHPDRAKRGEHLAKVDETKAARVRPGGDLWREYVPLCRGGNGAEPEPAGVPQPMEVEGAPAAAQSARLARRGDAAGAQGAQGAAPPATVAAGCKRKASALGAGTEQRPSVASAAGRGGGGDDSDDEPLQERAMRRRLAQATAPPAPVSAPPPVAPPAAQDVAAAAQQLQNALGGATVDEGAAAQALQTLAGVQMTKDLLRSTGILNP